MDKIKLVIPGKPIAKRRPRFYRRGNFVGTYNDQQTEEGRFLLMVKEQINGHRIDGPIFIKMAFIFERPKSHFGTGKNAGNLKSSAPQYHTTKSDIDNCIKFSFDCLNGIAWKDDCQIVQIQAEKGYGERARTEIEIYSEPQRLRLDDQG